MWQNNTKKAHVFKNFLSLPNILIFLKFKDFRGGGAYLWWLIAQTNCFQWEEKSYTYIGSMANSPSFRSVVPNLFGMATTLSRIWSRISLTSTLINVFFFYLFIYGNHFCLWYLNFELPLFFLLLLISNT